MFKYAQPFNMTEMNAGLNELIEVAEAGHHAHVLPIVWEIWQANPRRGMVAIQRIFFEYPESAKYLYTFLKYTFDQTPEPVPEEDNPLRDIEVAGYQRFAQLMQYVDDLYPTVMEQVHRQDSVPLDSIQVLKEIGPANDDTSIRRKAYEAYLATDLQGFFVGVPSWVVTETELDPGDNKEFLLDQVTAENVQAAGIQDLGAFYLQHKTVAELIGSKNSIGERLIFWTFFEQLKQKYFPDTELTVLVNQPGIQQHPVAQVAKAIHTATMTVDTYDAEVELAQEARDMRQAMQHIRMSPQLWGGTGEDFAIEPEPEVEGEVDEEAEEAQAEAIIQEVKPKLTPEQVIIQRMSVTRGAALGFMGSTWPQENTSDEKYEILKDSFVVGGGDKKVARILGRAIDGLTKALDVIKESDIKSIEGEHLNKIMRQNNLVGTFLNDFVELEANIEGEILPALWTMDSVVMLRDKLQQMITDSEEVKQLNIKSPFPYTLVDFKYNLFSSNPGDLAANRSRADNTYVMYPRFSPFEDPEFVEAVRDTAENHNHLRNALGWIRVEKVTDDIWCFLEMQSDVASSDMLPADQKATVANRYSYWYRFFAYEALKQAKEEGATTIWIPHSMTILHRWSQLKRQMRLTNPGEAREFSENIDTEWIAEQLHNNHDKRLRNEAGELQPPEDIQAWLDALTHDEQLTEKMRVWSEGGSPLLRPEALREAWLRIYDGNAHRMGGKYEDVRDPNFRDFYHVDFLPVDKMWVVDIDVALKSFMKETKEEKKVRKLIEDPQRRRRIEDMKRLEERREQDIPTGLASRNYRERIKRLRAHGTPSQTLRRIADRFEDEHEQRNMWWGVNVDDESWRSMFLMMVALSLKGYTRMMRRDYPGVDAEQVLKDHRGQFIQDAIVEYTETILPERIRQDDAEFSKFNQIINNLLQEEYGDFNEIGGIPVAEGPEVAEDADALTRLQQNVSVDELLERLHATTDPIERELLEAQIRLLGAE